jgi:hypothetical protein
MSAKVSGGEPLAVVRYRRMAVKSGESPPWFDYLIIAETVAVTVRSPDTSARREINGFVLNGAALG